MSRDPREDDAPVPGLPDRADGSVELDQRAALRVLLNDPAVRNYLFAGLGSLGLIFLILFERGSDIGGLLIVVLGAAGLLLRWAAAPPLILIVLAYFMIFPFGIPGEGFESRWEIEDGRFRPADLLLTLAVLMYVACQYRVYGLVSQAVAWEGAGRRKDEPTTRRPPALVRPNELGVLFGIAVGLVVAGQLVWWLATGIEVVPGKPFPFRVAEPGRGFRRAESPGTLAPGLTRFVVLVGLLFFGLLVARLVFGYWRLRRMGPAEARMTLLDTGWLETKRERSRVEKWRIWGRKRAAARAAAEDARARTAEKAGRAKAGGDR
jgi:hypothetical protein